MIASRLAFELARSISHQSLHGIVTFSEGDALELIITGSTIVKAFYKAFRRINLHLHLVGASAL
jgi:hypothetical protein